MLRTLRGPLPFKFVICGNMKSVSVQLGRRMLFRRFQSFRFSVQIIVFFVMVNLPLENSFDCFMGSHHAPSASFPSDYLDFRINRKRSPNSGAEIVRKGHSVLRVPGLHADSQLPRKVRSSTIENEPNKKKINL